MFRLSHRLRLQRQIAAHAAGEHIDNRLRIVDLTSWERSVLREGFRALRRAQDALDLLCRLG